MIETLLEQVNAAVDRFVAKNPSLRNDRDDLVQDVFLKILPPMNGQEFSLSQCRAFAHQATFWVCHTALRAMSHEKRKKTMSLGAAGVYYLARKDDKKQKIDRLFSTVSEVSNGGFIMASSHIDWDRVEEIAEANDALFAWFAIEPNAEVSENLRKQIVDKFEYVIP